MKRTHLQFLKKGETVKLDDFSPRATVLDWLRLDRRETGTKEGCAEGDCGACAVVIARDRDGHIAYEPANACITLLGQLDGAELITVEDLAENGTLHPVQAAMADQHGSQCGYCTPGIVMSLFAHYRACGGKTDHDRITDVLAGNLCRCTGYRPIVTAALTACSARPNDRFERDVGPRRQAMHALADGAEVFIGNEKSFFAAPSTEDELAELCAKHPDATILGGATDVGLWITKKLVPIEKVIHVGRVASLDKIEQTAEGTVIGAAVSLARAVPVLSSIDPDVGEVLRRFGSIQVRASGTVGGNIANGSPIGDLAPMLIALDTTLELRHGDKVRQIPLDAFFLDYGKQDRKPGEFVRRLIVPNLPQAAQFRAYKVSKRVDEDISAVLGAFRLTVEDTRIVEARIAFGGMAGIPKRAANVERTLKGMTLAASADWPRAVEAMRKDFTPLTDVRGSADYRNRVAANLVVKALAEIGGLETFSTRIINHRTFARAAN